MLGARIPNRVNDHRPSTHDDDLDMVCKKSRSATCAPSPRRAKSKKMGPTAACCCARLTVDRRADSRWDSTRQSLYIFDNCDNVTLFGRWMSPPSERQDQDHCAEAHACCVSLPMSAGLRGVGRGGMSLFKPSEPHRNPQKHSKLSCRCNHEPSLRRHVTNHKPRLRPKWSQDNLPPAGEQSQVGVPILDAASRSSP